VKVIKAKEVDNEDAATAPEVASAEPVGTPVEPKVPVWA
jgi:hypothetical protein